MNIDSGIFQTFLQNLGLEGHGVQFFVDILTIVFPMTSLCALAGLPFMALAAQVLGQMRQRSCYDKGARQLAGLAFGLGWLCTLPGAWLAWTRLENAAQYPAIVQGYMVWLLLLATATLCVSLHFALWKSLRNWRLCHQCLALLGGSFAGTALYAGLCLLDTECRIDQGLPPVVHMWQVFVPQDQSALWNVLYYLPGLAVGLAAGLGALWLLLRRKRDDYGRDHYNVMLPWCATWARNAWGLLWLVLLTFSLMDMLYGWEDTAVHTLQPYIFQALHVLLWSVPALLWAITARSKVPLRHKLTLLLAQLIAMAFTVPLCITLL